MPNEPYDNTSGNTTYPSYTYSGSAFTVNFTYGEQMNPGAFNGTQGFLAPGAANATGASGPSAGATVRQYIRQSYTNNAAITFGGNQMITVNGQSCSFNRFPGPYFLNVNAYAAQLGGEISIQPDVQITLDSAGNFSFSVSGQSGIPPGTIVYLQIYTK